MRGAMNAPARAACSAVLIRLCPAWSRVCFRDAADPGERRVWLLSAALGAKQGVCTDTGLCDLC